MSPDNPTTCGQGVAANAALPAKLAELIAVRAEVLERHIKALDLSDPRSQLESEAYARLVASHRSAAASLRNLSEQMASYGDLPMGRHDMAAMSDPKGQMEAFGRYVSLERELVELLRSKLEQEQAMLRAFGDPPKR
jgi:hypothetical protein